MGERPIGITIIAVLLAIGGVIQVLTGTEVLGITSFGFGAAAEAIEISGWASIISGVLTIIVAGGLFTLAGWAWLLTVVVMIIRVVVDAFVIVSNGLGSTLSSTAIANIVFSLIVLWYFNRANVKAAFGR